jgi:hypothetical protein
MHRVLKDTAGLGTFFWLVGYLAGIVLFFTPLKESMGWVMLAAFTPFTIAVTWWWFRGRGLPLPYFPGVGVAWTVIAVVLDFLFIVQLFGNPQYYAPDVLIYYALTFLIPVGVGLCLNRQSAP